MHELALTEQLVRLIEKEASQQRFSRVKKIRLEKGPLSGVDSEAMLFCFDAVSRGTVAEGASLEFISLDARAFCQICEREVFIKDLLSLCPHCQKNGLKIKSGFEVRIKDLEVT